MLRKNIAVLLLFFKATLQFTTVVIFAVGVGASNRREECKNFPSVIGYNTLEDLIFDIQNNGNENGDNTSRRKRQKQSKNRQLWRQRRRKRNLQESMDGNNKNDIKEESPLKPYADPNFDEIYRLCPDTVFTVVKAAIPIPRSNIHIQCGSDGSSRNNCIVSGGSVQLIIPFKDDDDGPIAIGNCLVSGVIFIGSTHLSIGAAASIRSNVRFEDCHWKSHSGTSTILVRAKSSYDDYMNNPSTQQPPKSNTQSPLTAAPSPRSSNSPTISTSSPTNVPTTTFPTFTAPLPTDIPTTYSPTVATPLPTGIPTTYLPTIATPLPTDILTTYSPTTTIPTSYSPTIPILKSEDSLLSAQTEPPLATSTSITTRPSTISTYPSSSPVDITDIFYEDESFTFSPTPSVINDGGDEQLSGADDDYDYLTGQNEVLSFDDNTVPAPVEATRSQCVEWCTTGTANWIIKCSFQASCGGCSECDYSDCLPWCDADADDWSVKCGYKNETCSACSICDDGTHRTLFPITSPSLASIAPTISMQEVGTQFLSDNDDDGNNTFDEEESVTAIERKRGKKDSKMLTRQEVHSQWQRNRERVHANAPKINRDQKKKRRRVDYGFKMLYNIKVLLEAATVVLEVCLLLPSRKIILVVAG